MQAVAVTCHGDELPLAAVVQHDPDAALGLEVAQDLGHVEGGLPSTGIDDAADPDVAAAGHKPGGRRLQRGVGCGRGLNLPPAPVVVVQQPAQSSEAGPVVAAGL